MQERRCFTESDTANPNLGGLPLQSFPAAISLAVLLFASSCGKSQELSIDDTTTSELNAACSATLRLKATRTYEGGPLGNGESFSDGRSLRGIPVELPRTLPVVVGNAGNQDARLTYLSTEPGAFGTVTCRYRGGASQPNPTTPEDRARGQQYEFVSCSDGSLPGNVFRMATISLEIDGGDSSAPVGEPETTVAVSLQVQPASCVFTCDVDPQACTTSAIYEQPFFYPAPFDGDAGVSWIEASTDFSATSGLNLKAAAHALDGAVLYQLQFAYDIQGALAAGASSGRDIASFVTLNTLTDSAGAPLADEDGRLRYTLIEGLARLGETADPAIANALRANRQASTRNCFGPVGLVGSFAVAASVNCATVSALVLFPPFGAFAAALGAGKCGLSVVGALARKSEALCCLGQSQPGVDCTCAERTNGSFPDQTVRTRIFPPGLFYSCECKQPESPCDTAVCTAQGKTIEPNGPASCSDCANRVCDTASDQWQCQSIDPTLGGTCSDRTCFRVTTTRSFQTIDRPPNDRRCYFEGTDAPRGFTFEVPAGGTFAVITDEPGRNTSGRRSVVVDGVVEGTVGAEISQSTYCCGCDACCRATLENRVSYTIDEIPCPTP